jgi:hypothetical protein
MNPIIVDISWIAEYLKEPKLAANFSDSQILRIATFVAPMVEKDSAAERADCRRAALGLFISLGKWDEGIILGCIKMLRTNACMLKHSQETEKPILYSFAAAADAEGKPSRQARRPIQGAVYVYTRLEGRAARGRQAADSRLDDEAKTRILRL